MVCPLLPVLEILCTSLRLGFSFCLSLRFCFDLGDVEAANVLGRFLVALDPQAEGVNERD